MATYKKRGYKPKTHQEKIEDIEDNSTTAEVFNTLDESANRTEEWVVNNQNYIFGVVGIVALIVLGIMGYNKFIAEPNAKEAMNEMASAQEFFNEAMSNSTEQDSLFNLALTGANGKYGMLDIIEEYGSTPAGNLANYYAGTAYLNMNKYQEAITYLSNFSSDDIMLSAISKGAIGDAFVQLDQKAEGLEYYEKAIAANSNEFTTPIYLMKAARTAMDLGNNQKAVKFLERIKEEFSASSEAGQVDVLLGKAQASL